MKKYYEDPEVMIVDISDVVTLGDNDIPGTGGSDQNSSGSL